MRRRRKHGAGARAKAYDQAYFDRWYRDPRRRIATPADITRKARLVVGVAESLLQRPVRSALDIGCGEGAWRRVLQGIRPGLRYVGVDSSAYVVSRFGASRGIRYGTFGTLATADLAGPFDLVICCDMLQYVEAAELSRGLASVAGLLGGVAYLEAYTTSDEVVGDRRGWHHRAPAWYRRAFGRAGLVGVGMHCWVGDALRDATAALERSGR
ncbi:MAG TPA: class I SAM-dependent methyltransferase [Gemmatimonadaceae bacterium]|nr:class I SAM-dependent methyltransferase [Gemmatimonadaceae bacterium]